MTFANPAILVALAALAIPVAVHLLGRRRRRVILPTARLAEAAHAASRGRMWLRRLALLALRLAAVALAVLAVAGPRFGRAAATREATGPWIVCLDSSPSMQAFEDGRTRLDRGLKALADAVRGLPASTPALVVAPGSAPRRGPAGRVASGAGGSVPPGWQEEPLGRLIHRALAACRSPARPTAAGSPLAPGSRLVVITDATPHALRDVKPGEFQDLDAQVLLVAVGGPVENAGLGLPEAAVVEAGGRRHLSVEVGVAPRRAGRGETVRLTLAGDTRSWTAEASAGAAARFLAPISGDGPWQGQVQIAEPDALAADDVRYFTAAVPRRVRVLVVDAAGPGEPLPRSAFFIAAAFAGGGPGPAIAPRTLPAEGASAAALGAADAVFWVGSNGPPDASALERFVAGGGLVWVPTGAEPPGADLAAILGVSFGRIEDQPDGVTMDPAGYGSDLLAAFEGGTGGDVSRPVFKRRLLLSPKEAARGVAFMDGRPAICARRIGRGRAVTLAAGPAQTWGDLATRPEFVVLMHSILESLGEDDRGRNLVLGGPPCPRGITRPGHHVLPTAAGGQVPADGHAASANLDPAETADLVPQPAPLKAAFRAERVRQVLNTEYGTRKTESATTPGGESPLDPAVWLALALAAVLAAEALAASWRPDGRAS